jgi:hypothetical protein
MKQLTNGGWKPEMSGNRQAVRLQPADSQPYQVGCTSENREYLQLKVKESKTGKMKLI